MNTNINENCIILYYFILYCIIDDYNNDIYEVTVNTTKLSIIINYLNIHSLKTNKFIVYLNIRKT